MLREKNKKSSKESTHSRLGKGAENKSFLDDHDDNFGVDKLSGISLNDIFNNYDIDDIFEEGVLSEQPSAELSLLLLDEQPTEPLEGVSAPETSEEKPLQDAQAVEAVKIVETVKKVEEVEEVEDADVPHVRRAAAENAEETEEDGLDGGKTGFFSDVYRQIFYLGLKTQRYTKRFFKAVFRLIARPFRFFAALARIFFIAVDTYVFSHIRRYVSEFFGIFGEGARAIRGISTACRRDKLAFFPTLWHYISVGGHLHKKLLSLLIYTVLPVALALTFVVRVSATSRVTHALEVIYNGESIGYISSESVYLEARARANELLNVGMEATGSTGLIDDAKLSLALVSLNELSDADALCDKLISNSGSNITNACGVYIDGNFLCAVKNESDALTIFDRIISHYKVEDENVVSYGFTKDIEYLQGLFPDEKSVIWDIGALTAYLTDVNDADGIHTVVEGETLEEIAARYDIREQELAALNPSVGRSIEPGQTIIVPEETKLFNVTVVKSEVYRDSIDYETVKYDDSSRFKGDNKVVTKGIEGEDKVTRLVTYVDGEAMEYEEISRVRVSEPVSEVIKVGTKSTTVSSDSGSYDISVSNRGFVWPTPGCHTISSGYGGRSSGYHKGVDITTSGAAGKIIVAAKSGTVEYAGSHSSYGNYIIINHGGGVKTLYAHCQSGSLRVSSGDWVSAGETIARVGSTGNATGPHLHFEVIVNGSQVNPMRYIG